jgi:hypothetical protein
MATPPLATHQLTPAAKYHLYKIEMSLNLLSNIKDKIEELDICTENPNNIDDFWGEDDKGEGRDLADKITRIIETYYEHLFKTPPSSYELNHPHSLERKDRPYRDLRDANKNLILSWLD